MRKHYYRLVNSVLAAGIITAASISHADEFPNRPIKIVVGFGQGVGIEVTTRLLGDLVAKELGQPVIIDNKPGASTMIAANYVAQAPKDGYTMLLLNVQQYNNHLMYQNVQYKNSDFTPVALGGLLSIVMATSKGMPATSVQEFISYTRNNPGKVNYGYWGVGGSPHLMAARMEAISGLEMKGIGYKNPAQATTDLVSDRIQLFFTSATHGLSLLQAGHANILAVGTPERMSKLPDTPTFSESGIQNMPNPWWGYAVPAGTPPDVVQKLRTAFLKAMTNPSYQKWLAESGSVPLALDKQEDIDAFIVTETERWADAIRPLNLKLD